MGGEKGKGAAKAILAALALLLAVAAFLIIGGLAIASGLDKPTGKLPPDGIVFEVPRGATGISVARRLAEAEALRSELLFRALMKIRGVEDRLQAGEYRVEPDMGGGRILEMMVEGRQILLRLSVPEGLSVREIAAAAEEAGVATAAEFLRSASDPSLAASLGLPGQTLAGYLFPDTYLLPKDAGAEALLRMMVGNYKRRLAEELPESSSIDAAEARKRLIVASIVEREYRRPEEAALMAGVFYNRLKIGMALQSCATVVYVLTERLGKPHPKRLFDRDLAVRDPFNTYVYAGLPPEPICNPGLTALKAAYRPESSDFLYFRLVDESSGRHYFSQTLDEHIKAAALAVKPGSR